MSSIISNNDLNANMMLEEEKRREKIAQIKETYFLIFPNVKKSEPKQKEPCKNTATETCAVIANILN
jgi:hypothetical protein